MGSSSCVALRVALWKVHSDGHLRWFLARNLLGFETPLSGELVQATQQPAWHQYGVCTAYLSRAASRKGRSR